MSTRNVTVIIVAIAALFTAGAIGYVFGQQSSPQPSGRSQVMPSPKPSTPSPTLAATTPPVMSMTTSPTIMAPMPSPTAMAAMPSPTTMAMGGSGTVPPVKGYYRGQEIHFMHTEASDSKVAEMLTSMMASPVIVVPQLKSVPDSVLSKVFVFTNGIKDGGPFGFQPDVFDSVPGDEAYSPLRALNLVSWQDGVTARELRSVDEVQAAAAKGEVTLTRPGVVVNMPMLDWPGGHR